MITAEEFLKNSKATGMAFNREAIQETMIEFAQLHVEAALLTASKKVQAYAIEGDDSAHMGGNIEIIVIKKSILNAYPKELIK